MNNLEFEVVGYFPLYSDENGAATTIAVKQYISAPTALDAVRVFKDSGILDASNGFFVKADNASTYKATEVEPGVVEKEEGTNE